MTWGRRRPPTPARAQLIVAPAHRGRGESYTLRILTDAFTGALEEHYASLNGRCHETREAGQQMIRRWDLSWPRPTAAVGTSLRRDRLEAAKSPHQRRMGKSGKVCLFFTVGVISIKVFCAILYRERTYVEFYLDV